jgi:HlyD family type I secretion membrane fusion protein
MTVEQPNGNFRKVALTGYALIFLIFGVFGGWAAIARIDGAIIAPGTVSVQSKRQVVQHLEGGIIGEIRVRDGQAVNEGDVLFILDDTTPRANHDATRNQLDVALASEARLMAERRELNGIEFPEDLMRRKDDPRIAAILLDQSLQFRDRKRALEGQIGILSSRVAQFGQEIQGLGRERASAEKQLELIDQELSGIRDLYAKNLVPITRLASLERERARLDGTIGRNSADIAKSENNIGEMRLQEQQLHQKFQEEVSTQILDIRQKLHDLRERLNIASNVLRRNEIKAPRDGEVQNVNPRIYTIGAVVRPGDTLLEIVPKNDDLIIEAQVQVSDVDRLATASNIVEVRLPAFHQRDTPVILGKTKTVSRDRLMDEATRTPYFQVVIEIAATDIPPEIASRVRPGMPAEVVFNTGERTVFSYLTKPLTDAFHHSLRER